MTRSEINENGQASNYEESKLVFPFIEGGQLILFVMGSILMQDKRLFLKKISWITPMFL